MPNPNMFFDQKDAHRKMTQIGVIGSSRTLTGSQLVTKTILAAKCRFAKFVISQAGNSETCRPPNLKTWNLKNWLKLILRLGPSVAKEMSSTIQSFFYYWHEFLVFNFAGHLLKCLPPHIRNQNAKVRICCIFPPCQIQIYFSTKKTRTEKWRRLVWSVRPELSRGADWRQNRFLPNL